MSTDNINWENDKSRQHNIQRVFGKDKQSIGEWRDKQWIDVTNPHFINWMRITSLTNVYKLWYIINDDMDPGE